MTTIKVWTKEEDDILRDFWENSILPTSELKFENTNLKQIYRRAGKLQLKRNPEVHRQTLIKRNKSMGRDMSYETVIELLKDYKNRSVLRIFDSSLYQSALRLGLLENMTVGSESFNFPQTILYLIVCGMFPDCKVRMNDRTAIKPKEIDVYVVDKRIGFEYDGKMFHNSDEAISRDIFKDKLCETFGISLFRIKEHSKHNPFDSIISQLSNYGFDVSRFNKSEVLNQIRTIMEKNDVIDTNIIDKYSDLKTFKIENPKLYTKLYRTNSLNLLDGIRTTRKPNSYTDQEILDKINSCKTKFEFREKFHGLYLYMMRNKKKINQSYSAYIKLT